MGYAEGVVGLLAEALKEEEIELRELAGSCPRPSLRSVCQYEEEWVKLLVGKRAMRGAGPHLKFEKKRVDITISDGNDVRGHVELKGPLEAHVCDHSLFFDRIIDDFRKQSNRLKDGLECVVVLLVSGYQRNCDSWTAAKLLPALTRRVPTVRPVRIPAEDISLNDSGRIPHYLSIVAFRLEKAS
jgi:hypothetical protein